MLFATEPDRLVHDLRENVAQALAVERKLAGQRLVHDDPEREQVRAEVDDLVPLACSGLM